VSEDPIGLAGGLNVYTYVNNRPVSFYDSQGYAEHGKRKLNVNLPDGTTVTKQTPADQVRRILERAKDLGLSQKQIRDLEGLLKVIRRGGTIGILVILDILTDPAEANAGEEDMLKACREDPDSCRPPWAKSKSCQ
jgi:uncharacterized protein RhaS with RHS repeats